MVSGGMDSLVTAALAAQTNSSVCFLHISYGQRTEAKERDCFHRIVEHYKPDESLLISMDWLRIMGGSSLTDKSVKITIKANDRATPNTYVPFRNANFISTAVSWAEVIGANKVYIGAVEEDSSGYPDTRHSFIKAMQTAIWEGTKSNCKIDLIAPVIHMKKSEIVKLGFTLKAPFEYSWSCYFNDDIACGICESCLLRLKAFQDSGFSDCIPYARI